MAIVIINGHELEISDRERLNGIQAARRLGIEIPHYCWHPGLSVVGSCRMCLVEVGTRDGKTGKVVMQPKLAPACQTPMTDGTVMVTNSEKVARARAMVEEDLLLRHPIDCPICDKAGECTLQDYHFLHGEKERRADIRPFTSRRRDVGPSVTLFVDRCVMCSRCVRFTREVAGTKELLVSGRGTHETIDVVPGFPLANRLAGNVVDLCPVGALGDKDFLYKQRVWFLKRHAGVCTHCSTGCSIWVEENQDRVWRIKPRENLFVNRWWVCDDGRYGYPHVHDPRRLTRPRRRDGQSWTELDWTRLPEELRGRLRDAGRLAAVVSPHLTVEEAYLLCRTIRQADPQARIAMGPIPAAGEDERFPGGFRIHAEKCPNRRGVEEVVAHFARGVIGFDQLLLEVEKGRVDGLWISGGYKSDWMDSSTVARLSGAKLVIVQDLFPSLVSDRATYALPSAAFAEREGSYVNYADRLQSVRWAIRPPAGVRSEGSLFWQMLGRTGLYDARAVLDEVARGIGYFSAAGGEVPETGISLRVNLLAGGEGGEGRGTG